MLYHWATPPLLHWRPFAIDPPLYASRCTKSYCIFDEFYVEEESLVKMSSVLQVSPRFEFLICSPLSSTPSMYLWAECSLLMKVSLHEVAELSGSDFTSETQKQDIEQTLPKKPPNMLNPFPSLLRQCDVSSPSLGSNAAGPACNCAVDVREVGVIYGVVSCTNLQMMNTGIVFNRTHKYNKSTLTQDINLFA